MSDPAVLGKGLRVRGRVRGDGDLRVEADIEGDILVSGTLELTAGATVNGAVEAASLLVSGTLEGNVNAKGTVTITASGTVRGDIKAAELSLEEGGNFVGHVDADFELPASIA